MSELHDCKGPSIQSAAQTRLPWPNPGADLAFVPLDETHAAAVVRWRNDPVDRSCFLSDQVLTQAGQIDWIRRQRECPADETYVAVQNGVPVGMVALYDIDFDRHRAEFGRILIDPGYRRLGFGRAMTGWLLARGFWRAGLDMIYANCLTANRPIHDLLDGFGFRPAGQWVHQPSGRVVDRLEVSRCDWRAHDGVQAGHNQAAL